MAERKETPDVLAELLSGAAAGDPASPRSPEGKVSGLRRGRAAGRKAGQPVETVPAAIPAASTTAAVAWECELVSFQDYHGWRPRYVNGRELPSWMEGPLIADYLNARGAGGWELAAATSGIAMYGASDRVQLYFKRAKQG